MLQTRQLLPRRAVLAVIGAAASLLVVAPVAAHADPARLCIANTTTAKCPTTGFDYTADTFAKLKTYIDANDVEPDSEIQVEPGTYTGFNLDKPTDLDVHGDAAYPNDYPVITSSTGAAVSLNLATQGASFRHLRIAHTGAPGTAFASANEFALHDDFLDSTGAALVQSGTFGAITLDDVVATSKATGTSAVGIPLIQTSSASTQSWYRVGVYAEDRADAIVARDAGVVNADLIYADAHGVSNGKGGAALTFVGFDPGGEPTRNPNVILKHAWLYGGSFGLAAFSTQLHAFDVLATADGLAPEQVKIGSDQPVEDGGGALVDDPLRPAGIGSGAASNLTLSNVTAVAAGAGSDGIVANSAYGNDDGNGFDFAAFVSVTNSIFRGAHADAEVLDGLNAFSQQGLVATDHDNFVTAIGATNNITHGQTVTIDPTDQIDDPQWVNPTAGPSGDFHVQDGSRTLQAAGYTPPDDTDLDGKPRPNPSGTAGDLGAYESGAAPAGPGTPPPSLAVAPGGSSGGGGSAVTPISAPAPVIAPAPAKPSNAFTITKTSVDKTGAITLTLQAPAAGAFAISGATSVTKKVKGHNKKTPVSFGTAKATAAGAASVTATIKPSGAVASALKKGTSLTVLVSVTFTPTGGTAALLTTTVKAKRKK